MRPSDNYDQPVFGQIPEEYSLEVFKFAAQFYLKVMQRSSMKTSIPKIISNLKGHMNRNPQCGRWLLEQFTYKEVLFESIVESGLREMRKICAGLLYCAMLTIYDEDKDKLNQYFIDPEVDKANLPTLTKFGLTLIGNYFDAQNDYPAFFNTYG